MRKPITVLACIAASLLLIAAVILSQAGKARANVSGTAFVEAMPETADVRYAVFDVEVLVHGQPLETYYARGRRYIEALEGAEYEVRVRNPLGVRVAVALSVDGLNTIDARRSSAYNSSKWVIEPYQTITISGWQMSSERARRFYFTNERNSYSAKLGQTANLGVITAVFFRERQSSGIVVPPPYRPRPMEDGESNSSDKSSNAPSTSAGRNERGETQARKSESYPVPDDDYAATGIGRNVRHDVRWINLDLESRPAAEITVRYEYHDALVRLGIIPRPDRRPDTLRRRERATGFSDRLYSPEP
ncbi:MAG TPA: hypothetical protein VF658_07285 [Pyrinomonadaceae bacterium]|jgi:hypothetical protein